MYGRIWNRLERVPLVEALQTEPRFQRHWLLEDLGSFLAVQVCVYVATMTTKSNFSQGLCSC